MRFDAVIFDLDGTLLDTLEDIADAVNGVLAARGFPPHPLDAFRYFVGDGVGALARRALPERARQQEIIDACTGEIRAAYASNWNAKTKPYDGIAELLDGLAARGVKMAVLSNKPDDFTQQCVAGLLPRWKFDAILGHQEDLAAKPDPAGAARIAEQLGVPPDRVLYLGDTNVDMRTAVAAGMYPVGALWGFRTREELLASGAQVLATKPQDVLDLLG